MMLRDLKGFIPYKDLIVQDGFSFVQENFWIGIAFSAGTLLGSLTQQSEKSQENRILQNTIKSLNIELNFQVIH